MADNEFQVEAIGEIYAQALINEAQKQNALADITDDVQGIGMLLDTNATFVAFTQILTIGEDERLAAIDKVFAGRVHPLTLNTLKSMARRDRFMFLRGFVEGFAAILKKMSGRVDVELVTPIAMPPEAVERIRVAIGKSIEQTADISATVDPRLIGGMTVRVGDTLIDGSVATQLARLKEQIKIKGTNALQNKMAGIIS